MNVIIKDKEGIATILRGRFINNAEKHPALINHYRFTFGKDIWVCSGDAIDKYIAKLSPIDVESEVM